MPNPEWGVKRVCPTTGKRFYDLNKTPIISPYTGEEVDIDSTRRKVISAAAPRGAAQKDDDTLVEDLDSDDDLLAEDSSEKSSIDDDLLEDEDDDNVSLDDLADVPDEEE